jgi:hypothetical protein
MAFYAAENGNFEMNLNTVNNLIIVCFCLIINYIEANDEISVTTKSQKFVGLKKTIDEKKNRLLLRHSIR